MGREQPLSRSFGVDRRSVRRMKDFGFRMSDFGCAVPGCRNPTSEILLTMPTTYLEAIREGLWEEMERDPNVFLIGEDIGTYGGAFKMTAGFLDHFGERRVVDPPIAESAIVGAAIGASLIGLRPVA